jgi:hypothetical protein
VTAAPPSTPAPPPKTAAPTPTPASTPTPTPAVPQIVDPTLSTTYPMSESPEGMTPGTEQCLVVSIDRDYPLVDSPTGSVVYAIDKLWARRTDWSIGWYVAASGELYYNGTHGSTFIWYNAKTNGAAFGNTPEDSWDVNPGYTVIIIQYVWDEGIWYRSDEQECSF